MTIALRYTVLPGDTLSHIAAAISAVAGVTADGIGTANPGLTPTGLQVGDVLNVPKPGGTETVLRYTVLSGDSYSSIAAGLSRCGGLGYRAIAAANAGLDPNVLSVGQVLDIPATDAAEATGQATGAGPSVPGGAPVEAPVQTGDLVGFWRWTWSRSPMPPEGCNAGLAFSGWADVDTAVQQSDAVRASVPEARYITLGGGNENGAFTAERLASVRAALGAGRFDGYAGLALDVEEGAAGLSGDFAQVFAAAQSRGLKVMVTVSHSAPYGISDGQALMQAFFADGNIDFLSPQLYTTGFEKANQYATSHGVTWDDYAAAKARVVPSIVNAGMYADARATFADHGVTLTGFVQWSQA